MTNPNFAHFLPSSAPNLIHLSEKKVVPEQSLKEIHSFAPLFNPRRVNTLTQDTSGDPTSINPHLSYIEVGFPMPDCKTTLNPERYVLEDFKTIISSNPCPYIPFKMKYV